MNIEIELSTDYNAVIDHVRNTRNVVQASGQSLIIIQNGKIVTEHYEGHHSNIRNAKSLTMDSLFHIASVRKSYTGFCVAWAICNGHINSIDDPVLKYLPELNEETLKGITLRHFLTHTHGLRTNPDGNLFNYFHAGERWDYRDENIRMLAEIIRRTTGKTVAKIASEEIFVPLGFKKAGWYTEPSDDMVLTIFEPDGKSSFETRNSADGDRPNMFSTARELAYWGFLHLNNGKIGDEQIVNPEILKMATTVQSPKLLRKEFPNNGFLWQVQMNPTKNSEIGLNVPKGSFQILGICNQTLLVMPEFNLVAVRLLNRLGNPPGFNYLEDVKSFGDCVTEASTKLLVKI